MLSYLRNYKCKADPKNDSVLAVKYSNKLKELTAELNNIKAKNTLSPKEKEKYAEWPHILELRKQLKDDEALFISLYTDLLAPRRVEDFSEMIYVKSEPDKLQDINYYVEDKQIFIFRKYKTFSTYGEFRADAPKSVQLLLKEYIINKHRSYGESLFHMTEGMFSKKIGDICQKYLNKRATVDTFRHSFISQFNKTDPTVEQRKKIYKFMGHSLESQMYYDKSKDDFFQKDIHTVLPK